MFELLIVLALAGGVVIAAAVPWSWLFLLGAVTTSVGLAFGVATGLWYHIALARQLSAVSALTPRWWLRPVPLHERLDAAGRRVVMPWFYAGAVGFVVTVAGMALIVLGMTAGLLRAP